MPEKIPNKYQAGISRNELFSRLEYLVVPFHSALNAYKGTTRYSNLLLSFSIEILLRGFGYINKNQRPVA